MKKVISLSVTVILFITLLSGCSMGASQTIQSPVETTRQTVEINANNFLDYFNITFSASDYQYKPSILSSGMGDAYCTVKVCVSPKQTISAGSVYVVINPDFYPYATVDYYENTPSDYTDKISFTFDASTIYEHYVQVVDYTTTRDISMLPTNMEVNRVLEASGTITM